MCGDLAEQSVAVVEVAGSVAPLEFEANATTNGLDACGPAVSSLCTDLDLDRVVVSFGDDVMGSVPDVRGLSM
jgi:hypothetical protein